VTTKISLLRRGLARGCAPLVLLVKKRKIVSDHRGKPSDSWTDNTFQKAPESIGLSLQWLTLWNCAAHLGTDPTGSPGVSRTRLKVKAESVWAKELSAPKQAKTTATECFFISCPLFASSDAHRDILRYQERKMQISGHGISRDGTGFRHSPCIHPDMHVGHDGTPGQFCPVSELFGLPPCQDDLM